MISHKQDLSLWDFQEKSIESIRHHMSKGNRQIVLSVPTGGGKTEIACGIIKMALEKGMRTIFLADRTNLIQQTSARLYKYGIQHGIMQGDNTRNESADVVVGSKQTILRRNIDLSEFNLVIDDEAHDIFEYLLNYMKERDPFWIGLTATPYSSWMGSVYKGLVVPVSTNELIAAKRLSDYRVIVGKEANMEQYGGSQEWTNKMAESESIKIVGDVVSTWVKETHARFGGPVKTLVFSATVSGGEHLAESFNNLGYRFEVVSYKLPQHHNQQILNEFMRPDSKLHGVINAEMVVRGFDLPELKILIDERPYRKSLNSVIQKYGRVLRACEGKEYGLIIDHAGNFLRFQDALIDHFSVGPSSLINQEKVYREPTVQERKEKVCSCGHVFTVGEIKCPDCGAQRPKQQPRMTDRIGGQMVEYKIKKSKRDLALQGKNREDVWNEFCAIARARGKRSNKPIDLCYRQALAWYKESYGTFPTFGFNEDAEYASVAMEKYTKHLTIAYIKRMEKKKKETEQRCHVEG